jgi:PGF-pre-PGF domain-containing protein
MKRMSKEGRKWKGLTFWLMVVLLVATILLLGTVTAVQGTEVTEVKRYAPAGPPPGEEFKVTLRITGELPLVAGIVETIPDEFSFVRTTHPAGNYSVSGQKVAFAVINVTEIEYWVMAPSSGEGTFSGTWIDMLSENEGSIADTIVMVGGGGSGAIEEEVTPTPTQTLAVPTVTKATRSIPMMEAGKEVAMIFEDMDVPLIALKADNDVSDVKVVVERIERTPDIPEPSGMAYAYLGLKVENAGGAKIEGRVEFKVAKSWIADNNIDETTLTLNRYNSVKGWQDLATSKTGEDNDFVYFEAQTPGFSTFTITGKEIVEATYVRLDTIASVGVGVPLVVSGTTNRKEGFAIVITIKGPMELTPQTVRVEKGTFNATFDTTGAIVGAYTVKADDEDGHKDETTVEIVTAVPTPTAVVTSTPPGFEANLPALSLILVVFFAIVSLLVAGLFVVRKRRKGGDVK